ncbi:molybdopterin-dependent oxidoreductase [Nostoc sp. FACHB-87]|uniref:molybdopterin-dependent oxidoreductase n=1 Tax=Nostocaceae TaxID=1162 RepID=UPI0016880365|nr:MULTISPECIES: molybdopterin-dependent oxidoreductase [Nostocaceae]MBD2303464.1 molybdopterin-dependent oxidoreductase [Nostoc sp. FACHB-190]MBD2456263.1 molybdopterin-dependent oxidoreductase [Nostoc sp. FACHB-87]MBD2477684.1 molybdopterin-dependent oxidoreductase [Anabaena sp. FACHB-83]
MWLHLNLWKNLALTPLTIAIVCVGGCTNQPTDKQLEVWRKEAIARNAEIVANNTKKAQQSQWNLVIQGETTTGKSLNFNWQQLQTLATNHLKTTDPLDILHSNEIFDFRGVPVAVLLQQFAVASHVTDVTFVSFDSYYTTLSLKDLWQYPITLAIAKNNKPIARAQGGPLYLVFPYTQYPQLKQKYDSTNWAFYVSNIIVGTEPVKLRVNQHQVNLATLDKLPQVTLEQTVGYRISWPSGKVKLSGVRLRDIFSSFPEPLPAQGGVIIRGKAPFYEDAPVRLATQDLSECDILLVTRWGESRELIPAKMGGPLTLAFSSQCPAKLSQSRWVTFVEELTTTP